MVLTKCGFLYKRAPLHVRVIEEHDIPFKMINLTMCFKSMRRTKVILKHIQVSACQMSSNAGVHTDNVLFDNVGGKGVITLNRPKAFNALNLDMVRKICPQLELWEKDSAISLVIIKGAGEKAFCAGGDIRAIYDAGKAGDRMTQDFFKEEYIVNNRIGNYKKPYIAIIDGVTMGGGVGLSVHGKFRIATERTLFAMPETAIGLLPDVGGGFFLPQLRGKLGVYLALTGFRLKGRDVQEAGVATHFVQSSRVPELEDNLINLKSVSTSDVEEVLAKFHQESTQDSHTFVLDPHMAEIDDLFSGGTCEEIFTNLEKSGSEWAKKQLITLLKMSPTSMKVSLRQLLEGGPGRSLQECLQVEYRLTQRCMEDKDFFEGVRAVLVDKDNAPKWSPSSINEVTDEKINYYFSPLPPDRELHL